MRLALICIGMAFPLVCLGQDYYGAIAYSYETKAHGWATDHPSREAAEKAAFTGCAKLAQDCKPVLWFRNACGALATGSKGPGWEWGQDQATADRRAIAACAQHSKACTVKRRVCTQGKK